MAYHHKITGQVEFSETDMAGIVHFSNFFRYMERAEASFFRELGFPLVYIGTDETRGWPRVRANASFQAPLYFEEEFEVLWTTKHPTFTKQDGILVVESHDGDDGYLFAKSEV